MFSALVYDPVSVEWLHFQKPLNVAVAWEPGEVKAVIDAADSASRAGRYAVGYVSYEAAGAFDRALTHYPGNGKLPLAVFGIFEAPMPGQLAEPSSPLALAPVITGTGFRQAIDQVRAYLQAGDSYQVNFTHPLTGEVDAAPAAVFAFLYQAQPSPYAMFIETDDYAICSVSPELFFQREGERITMEPMKGTRPRGRFVIEDEELKADLAGSAKDRAENLMIVDMIRNDLGRIARPGTVRPRDLFTIRQYPTVWQQVSSVSAETDAGLLDIFTALFPCASVTGAPRARTMQIIRELEAGPRGVYTGAIGYAGPGNQARFSVGIRTLTIDKKSKRATYGVGGGIVWDSDAESEWAESLTKGEVLRLEQPDFDLLETMLAVPGEGIFLLARHLDRLQASATYFDYHLQRDAVQQTLERLHVEEKCLLRLLLSKSGEFTIEQKPLVHRQGPVRLRYAQSMVNSSNRFLFHKTTHRRIYEDARAAVADCDDVILWNERGELTETTISNLFVELAGELLTPPIHAGLLAGTYRQMLLGEGRAREACLRREDLQAASALFVANSVRGLEPAILVE